MSAVKGKERSTGEKKYYVGLAQLEMKAFNPSKAELNKLLGVEAKDDDKEVIYSSQDNDGNERQRMAFWLYDAEIDKYFVHSFLLTKKFRVNKDGTKVQIINSTCETTWVPFKEGTEEADANLVPVWFKNFTKKDKKTNEVEILGPKTWRKALSGEEELGSFLRAWLGKLNWRDVDTEVVINTDSLFKEKYNEIRELIGGNYETPFVALIGVRTDENDSTKKYQQVYGKMFLPEGFMKQVKSGKFSDWGQRTWDFFKKDVEGEYGPAFYTELTPLHEYDESQDITASSSTKKKEVSATSDEY